MDFEYKSQQWLLTLSEQWLATSKFWLLALAVVIVAVVPLKLGLSKYFDSRLLGRYVPPTVTDRTAGARELTVLRAEILPTSSPGIYSVYSQIQNPNPSLSAREFEYHFVFTDSTGQATSAARQHSYVLAGESRFLFLPSYAASVAPVKVELVIDSVRWSSGTGTPVRFEILQKRSGQNAEGNFFVEALVKNTQAWRIRKVEVQILVFDRQTKIMAVNSTEFTDLEPFESRYLRVLWPRPLGEVSQIEILAEVNPLDPGAVVDVEADIPAR